jgi:hypothetical protein
VGLVTTALALTLPMTIIAFLNGPAPNSSIHPSIHPSIHFQCYLHFINFYSGELKTVGLIAAALALTLPMTISVSIHPSIHPFSMLFNLHFITFFSQRRVKQRG